MWDNKLRGIVLKTLYDLDMISSIYHRVDMVQIICDLSEEDFNRIVLQLTEENLIESQLQRSYIVGNDMNAVRISQNGIDVINQVKESPIQIQLNEEMTI